MLYPLSYGRLVRAELYRRARVNAKSSPVGNVRPWWSGWSIRDVRNLRNTYPPGYGSATFVPLKESFMCSQALCPVCKKITWSGCGNHIEQALAGVPQDQLCTCN